MSQRLQTLQAQYETDLGALQVLAAKTELAEAEQAEAFRLDETIKALQIDIDKERKLEACRTTARSAGEFLKAPATSAPPMPAASSDGGSTQPTHEYARPRVKSVKSFTDDPAGSGGLTAEAKSYRFGNFCAAILHQQTGGMVGNSTSVKRCRDWGYEIKAQSEGVNTAGGVLVPDEFSNDIIVLREQYGVFRRNARVSQMASDIKRIPRRSGSVTAYWVGEGDTITESQKSWDQVTLVAKKMACLVKYSNELGEDALIDVGNDIADEIAWQFAYQEDLAGFNGDGTSTYGGITGLKGAYEALGGTYANHAGMIVMGAAGGWSSAVMGDLESVVGRLPQYAAARNARWYCSRSFYWNVMLRLALASGGVTEAEVINGGANFRFMGYPVEIAQVMPTATATNQICAYFGDLGLASKFGDRRQLTIAISEHLNFAEDQIALRGTERIDINVHDVGNTSATLALRVAGPIIALQTNAA